MRNVGLILICFVLICSCETEGLDNFQAEPIFTSNFSLDGTDMDISAGIAGYVMDAKFEENNFGSYDYKSSFHLNNNSEASQLNFYFDDFPEMNSLSELNSNIHSDIAFALNFTGTEGIELMPNYSGISDPYTAEWSIGETNNLAANTALIPLPILRDELSTPVQYTLEVEDKFSVVLESSFNYDLTQSCNASLVTTLNQNTLGLELTAFTQSPLQFNWSNGETTSMVNLPSSTEQISIDVISQNCDFNMDLNIADPSSLPDVIGYQTIFILGPATSFTGPGMVVEFVDSNGDIYRSDYGEQATTSLIEIDGIENYNTDLNGNKTVTLMGSVKCRLYSKDSSNFKEFNSEKLSIAIAYPG